MSSYDILTEWHVAVSGLSQAHGNGEGAGDGGERWRKRKLPIEMGTDYAHPLLTSLFFIVCVMGAAKKQLNSYLFSASRKSYMLVVKLLENTKEHKKYINTSFRAHGVKIFLVFFNDYYICM